MEIKVKNIDFSYKKVNYKENEIFNNLNLNFKKGQINGIIGKNGSGKSTLLELLNLVIEPTNGEITINKIKLGGKNFDMNKYHFDVGLLMQNPEDNFSYNTVKEELSYYIKLYHYRIHEIDKRISNSLKMVGLDDTYLNKQISILSNGEKRKLALASILIINPKVIILDEPVIGLNIKDKKEIIKLIILLKNRYKKTIIIASNNIDFIHHIVDYIFVIDNKKLVLEGNKYDVFKEQNLSKYGIKTPKLIAFSNKVLNKKNIRLGYRDDINDLIKDIYRCIK